jgi:hypothetical protein
MMMGSTRAHIAGDTVEEVTANFQAMADDVNLPPDARSTARLMKGVMPVLKAWAETEADNGVSYTVVRAAILSASLSIMANFAAGVSRGNPDRNLSDLLLDMGTDLMMAVLEETHRLNVEAAQTRQ